MTEPRRFDSGRLPRKDPNPGEPRRFDTTRVPRDGHPADLPIDERSINPPPSSASGRTRRVAPPPLPGRPSETDNRQLEAEAYQRAFDTQVSIVVGKVHELYESALLALARSPDQTRLPELQYLPPRAQVLLTEIIKNASMITPGTPFARQEEYDSFVNGIPAMTDSEVRTGLQRASREMLEELIVYLAGEHRRELGELNRNALDTITQLKEKQEGEIRQLAGEYEQKERESISRAALEHQEEKAQLIADFKLEKKELKRLYDAELAAVKTKAGQAADAERQKLTAQHQSDIRALQAQLGELAYVREIFNARTLRINELRYLREILDAKTLRINELQTRLSAYEAARRDLETLANTPAKDVKKEGEPQ